MKYKISIAVLFFFSSMANIFAQQDWFKDIKLSGYVIGQYQYTSKTDATPKDNFSTRLVRLSIDGKLLPDFAYRVQAQLNGTPGSSSGPRIVDAFIEWQRYGFAKVKVGQFKRAFTFENPMNPIDQGFISYAQVISKLSGFEDRVGEHSSNGRDIGVQLQGDLLPNSKGRHLLHYQIAIYNGQGTNMKDVNNSKDIIGGMWVCPLEGLRIGAFGWTGSYAHKNGTDVQNVARNRYAFSGEYKKNDWTLRTEYIHSQGKKFASNNSSDIKIINNDKADGWYIAGIAPVITNTVHLKARYDVYRDEADWNSSKNMYEVGLDYIYKKKVKAQVHYVRVNERSKHQNYNMVDCQLSMRF